MKVVIDRLKWKRPPVKLCLLPILSDPKICSLFVLIHLYKNLNENELIRFCPLYDVITISFYLVVVVVGAVRCSSCSSSRRPVQAGQGVGAELQVSQVEEGRRGVSSPGAGPEAGAGSGTWPGDRKGTR